MQCRQDRRAELGLPRVGADEFHVRPGSAIAASGHIAAPGYLNVFGAGVYARDLAPV